MRPMMQRALPMTLGAALLLGLTFGAPAPAQAQFQPQESKESQFRRYFVEGLKALTARKLPQSERLFLACVRLFPNRPVAYYNLACARSLMKDTTRAVQYLRQSFERGYRDLAHMNRDMDLDPIRRTPAYRKAMGEFEVKVLEQIQPALTQTPAGAAKFPVIVYLHNNRGRPQAEFDALKAAFPQWGVVAPLGPASTTAGRHYWDQRGEFIVMHRVRAYLKANPRVDTKQVFVMGEGLVGRLAVTCAANNGDVFSGVLAAGYSLNAGIGDADVSDLRAYLVIQKGNKAQAEAGRLARDAFAEVKSPVVLQRYELAKPFTSDRALVLRALAWLQGKKVVLPGAGKEKLF